MAERYPEGRRSGGRRGAGGGSGHRGGGRRGEAGGSRGYGGGAFRGGREGSRGGREGGRGGGRVQTDFRNVSLSEATQNVKQRIVQFEPKDPKPTISVSNPSKLN